MYCSYAWKALQAYEKAGLQVRWLLVAYQKDSSLPRAAAILQAKDRVAALRQNESGYATATFDGAIAPLAHAEPALTAMIEANNRLIDKMRLSGTPAFVWRDASGAAHTLLGMPRLSQWPAITGLPEQKIDAPELARFR